MHNNNDHRYTEEKTESDSYGIRNAYLICPIKRPGRSENYKMGEVSRCVCYVS